MTAQKTEQYKEAREKVSRGKILIADDYDEVRVMIKLNLELEGYEVLEATNGAEAVELASRARPDLILMDLNMPILDGISATRRIREDTRLRNVPIIALTAHGTSDYRLKALAAGCDEYVTRPVDLHQLESVIERLLSRN